MPRCRPLSRRQRDCLPLTRTVVMPRRVVSSLHEDLGPAQLAPNSTVRVPSRLHYRLWFPPRHWPCRSAGAALPASCPCAAGRAGGRLASAARSAGSASWSWITPASEAEPAAASAASCGRVFRTGHHGRPQQDQPQAPAQPPQGFPGAGGTVFVSVLVHAWIRDRHILGAAAPARNAEAAETAEAAGNAEGSPHGHPRNRPPRRDRRGPAEPAGKAQCGELPAAA